MCEKSVFVTHDGEFNAGQKLKSDWVSENGATTSTQCLSICPRDYDKLINHWVWGSNLRTNGTRRFYSKSHFTQMYPQSITHISPFLYHFWFQDLWCYPESTNNYPEIQPAEPVLNSVHPLKSSTDFSVQTQVFFFLRPSHSLLRLAPEAWYVQPSQHPLSAAVAQRSLCRDGIAPCQIAPICPKRSLRSPVVWCDQS